MGDAPMGRVYSRTSGAARCSYRGAAVPPNGSSRSAMAIVAARQACEYARARASRPCHCITDSLGCWARASAPEDAELAILRIDIQRLLEAVRQRRRRNATL